MPWRLVIAGCIGFFAATATGSTRSPFLPDMAADLGVSLPSIANLFGLTAAAWGVSSYLAGRASDRVGRRGFLIVCPALLAFAMAAAASAQNYWTLVVVVLLAGTFCGAFTTSILAEVAVRAHSTFHGRALGYVMSGQSLTLLFGIPLAAWLGARIGWRGMHLALAGLSAFAVVCMLLGLGRAKPRVAVGSNESATTLRQAMTGPIVRLFTALVVERVSFGLATFYYASYLRTSYDMAIDAVAVPLAGFAIGNIAGTVVGGQVADRLPYRRINFALALATSGVVALPWFVLQWGVHFTVALGVAFAFFNALGRPSLLAALADVPSEVRGVVMGMNSSVASIGWLTAALVGGWLYAGIGFAAFGPLMAVMCLAGALVVVPDSKIRQRHFDP
jgi:DHA1 family inner membrane transport protein